MLSFITFISPILYSFLSFSSPLLLFPPYLSPFRSIQITFPSFSSAFFLEQALNVEGFCKKTAKALFNPSPQTRSSNNEIYLIETLNWKEWMNESPPKINYLINIGKELVRKN